ncbi:TNT domain-containing protein [Bacillus carboniphilus]|uniref:TNT domain-containing protein n=1 Tax=Bacillus carboniphilus TaxID=86663 RepID=A0ABY9JV40_9BACI|nr:TNT domain-containing protein [Bacillus carboniphilus]WLR42593.1 TNT domain-containing protein [Bacillus carboniphilus]
MKQIDGRKGTVQFVKDVKNGAVLFLDGAKGGFKRLTSPDGNFAFPMNGPRNVLDSQFVNNNLSHVMSSVSRVDGKDSTMTKAKLGEVEGSRKSDHVISDQDRERLKGWAFPPSDELYVKYKHVYGNPEFFNQETGDINWPGTNGDPNIDDFVNGEFEIETLEPGKMIDRYGSNPGGQYFSPAGSSYESRALPPFMSKEPYTKYKVLKEFEVKSGLIAPWFDEVGYGIQFNTSLKIYDELGKPYDATVKNLEKLNYIEAISE